MYFRVDFPCGLSSQPHYFTPLPLWLILAVKEMIQIINFALMKIALAQLNYHTGNFEHNTSKILAEIEKAEKANAEIVVFAELALCGYPPRDFLEFDDFIDRCEAELERIARSCTKIACIIGAPARNESYGGKNLFNSAYFIADGKVQSVHHKALLPTYDVFDEYRYFEPGSEFQIVEFQGKRIALTICEDLWNVVPPGLENELQTLYRNSPMDSLIKQNPDFMINIAASPFSWDRSGIRMQVLAENCKKYNLPLFYVNHIGAQTELIFDGGSVVFNKKGELVCRAAKFEEELLIHDSNNLSPNTPTAEDEIELIHKGLILGIRDYFKKSGFKSAVLGLSGGIDSAVTYVLAQQALGVENVHGILMPSEFSSQHSIDDSIKLAKNTGGKYDIIPIKDTYQTLLKTMAPSFGDLSFGLAEENLQARCRGIIVMALSNKFGHILLNTSNKSENAVGYSTMYGDMCGGLGVIGDVYKNQVYALARMMNSNGEVVPENIITKAPSAELRPDQKDSDSLPDYDVLDPILYQFIERRKGPNEIIERGYDAATVNKILNLVNRSEFKRFQTPPILRVSSKAFGMGRRMPIVAKYTL
jgi:NAD+ synthase (glutamine-hydrolysing)